MMDAASDIELEDSQGMDRDTPDRPNDVEFERLNKRVVLKLDFVLLPFLSLLFLVSSRLLWSFYASFVHTD